MLEVIIVYSLPKNLHMTILLFLLSHFFIRAFYHLTKKKKKKFFEYSFKLVKDF